MKAREEETGSPYSPPEGSLEDPAPGGDGWGGSPPSDLLAGAWLLLVGRSFYVLFFSRSTAPHGPDAVGETAAAMAWPLLLALLLALVRAGAMPQAPLRKTLVAATLLAPLFQILLIEAVSGL